MFESLPGFREFFPESCFRRNALFDIWRRTAARFGFEEYDGPLLEPLELYVKKSGEEITGQLFSFTDKGGREVALRPEMTPTLARMIGSHAHSMRKPVKWFAIAENFRYERPSRGRLRSHYQLNADIYGEPGLGAEVELLSLLAAIFRALGLGPDEVRIRLSDRELWLAFLRGMGVPEELCLQVLGVIDKMERNPEEVSKKALTDLLGVSGENAWARIKELAAVRTMEELESILRVAGQEGAGGGDEVEKRLNDWKELFRLLELHGAGDFVQMDLGIVRGLAYYTGFVFEAFEAKGEGRALAGGGRYDQLVEALGGPSMPAAGFGFGDVMISLVLESLGKLPAYQRRLDVFVVFSQGEAESALARPAVAKLREAGFSVEYALRDLGFAKQFREANQRGARWVLICGADEAQRQVFKVKRMSDGHEEEVPAAGLEEFLENADAGFRGWNESD